MIIEQVLDILAYVLLIMAAISPAVWLLCAATTVGHRVAAVTLLLFSLLGYMGLENTRPAKQVNNLYNYGEPIE